MTVLNKDKIRLQLQENYDISQIETIEKILLGNADLYYIKNNKSEYILKEFQYSYTEKEMIKEGKILEHLSSDGISVPKYIKTINNEYYYKYSDKHIILQEFIPGLVKQDHDGSINEVLDCSRNLATIIKSLEKYPELDKESALEWVSKEKLQMGIDKHIKIINFCDVNNPIHKNIIDDMHFKISLIEKFKEYKFENLDNITYKNTHGDYNVLQLIYNEDSSIKATLDFVLAKNFPIVREIIRSYVSVDKCCRDGKININNFILYVKEFNKIIKLNKYDIKYIVDLYLVKLLISPFGYSQYLKSGNEKKLNVGIFRTKMCKFLYQNKEEITYALEKEIFDNKIV